MAADPAVVAALRQTDLFASLSDKALRRVAAMAKQVTHPAGKLITEEGGSGVGFHLIADGIASVQVGGTRRVSLRSGDYFGEVTLIDGKPRSATVVAETDIHTIFIARWNFEPLLDDEPEMTKHLLLVMCERLRRAEGH